MKRNNTSSTKFISARPDNSNQQNAQRKVGSSIHLRNSNKRQQNLRAYAYSLTGENNISINLSETAKTASIINYNNNDDVPAVITIPTYEGDSTHVENPYPNIDDEEFYAMLQYAEVLHETGHYLHTDQPTVMDEFDAIKDKLSSYPRQLQGRLMQISKGLWNAIEDGAMEEAVRRENGDNVAQRLAVKNETFIAQSGDTNGRNKQVTFDNALSIAATDLSKYDTGSLRRLLDDDDPSIQFVNKRHKELFADTYDDLRNAIIEAFTTPDPVNRTRNIFDFVDKVIETIVDEINTSDDGLEMGGQDDSAMGEHEKDDTENEMGQAQTTQSQGLDKDKQDVAQQQANISQQSVTIEKPPESDSSQGEESDSDDGDQQGEGEQQPQPGQDGQSGSDSEQGGDGRQDEEQPQNGGQQPQSGGQQQNDGGDAKPGHEGASGDDSETDVTCPDCGETDTEQSQLVVDGMVAARTSAPFDIDADWIDSIEFIKNDELCGFRVTHNGNVPTKQIEQQGYKVAHVNGNVEILELRSNYGDTEQVTGFECDNCGYVWLPQIGGE